MVHLYVFLWCFHWWRGSQKVKWKETVACLWKWVWRWQSKAQIFLDVTLSRGKTIPRKVGFIGKAMSDDKSEWWCGCLENSCPRVSNEGRLEKNCEAGWAQRVSAWDHFQGSKVLEQEAFWIMRCCVILKWPWSPLRLWRSPETERDLCWYTITVPKMLVSRNAMLNIVWWTTCFLFWEKYCVWG